MEMEEATVPRVALRCGQDDVVTEHFPGKSEQLVSGCLGGNTV